MNNFLQTVTNTLWNSEPEGVKEIIDRAVEDEVMAAELREKLGIEVDDDFILEELAQRDLEDDVFDANKDAFLDYTINSFGNQYILEVLVANDSLENVLNNLNSDDVLKHYSSYINVTDHADNNELINAVIDNDLVNDCIDISGQFNVFDAMKGIEDVQLFDWLITHNKVTGVVSELFDRFNNLSDSIIRLQTQASEQSNDDTPDSRFLLESITPASRSTIETIQARLDQSLVDQSTEDNTIAPPTYMEGCHCNSCTAHRERIEAASSQVAEDVEQAEPDTPQEIVEAIRDEAVEVWQTIREEVPQGVKLLNVNNPIRNVAPGRTGEFDGVTGRILQTWNT